jgi:hypothetical protein
MSILILALDWKVLALLESYVPFGPETLDIEVYLKLLLPNR